jgi:D-alanyl-D-alanine carboxypeptidase/D-alanyl-D-alanine-endopeptidase (penicillin-binding protein 4)
MRPCGLALALALFVATAHAQSPALPALTQPPTDAAQRRDWMRARLDELFALPTLAGSKMSVVVTEPDSGKVLYGRAEKNGLNAASNVKIITAAAALAQLGPEFRWKTAVYAQARMGGRWLDAGGEVPGDLYLRGSGDPTLAARDLGELATELVALGLRRVRGALVVDATAFEGGSVGPAFDQKVDSAAFRAPSSAASLNGNTVAVTVTPAAAAGGAARVVLDPASPYFIVSGRIITARQGPTAPSIETADAGNGQTRVVLSGRVRLGAEPRTLLRRVVHPELFVGQTFRQMLAKRGVVFDKPVRVAPLPAEGWRALVTHDSPPLAVVIQDINKRSSNFAAEQLVRTLGAEVVGRPGSWDKGLEAVARYLDGLGIPRSSYKMANGSGLYESSRFSAEQIVTVLRGAMRDFRIAGEFMASLSVAGADGTLAQRMAGTVAERYVRAKSGTLANVSCLSGIAGAPGQRPVVFSILMNDVAKPLEARLIQDRAAEILVSYLDPSPPRAPPPPPPPPPPPTRPAPAIPASPHESN